MKKFIIVLVLAVFLISCSKNTEISADKSESTSLESQSTTTVAKSEEVQTSTTRRTTVGKVKDETEEFTIIDEPSEEYKAKTREIFEKIKKDKNLEGNIQIASEIYADFDSNGSLNVLLKILDKKAEMTGLFDPYSEIYLYYLDLDEEDFDKQVLDMINYPLDTSILDELAVFKSFTYPLYLMGYSIEGTGGYEFYDLRNGKFDSYISEYFDNEASYLELIDIDLDGIYDGLQKFESSTYTLYETLYTRYDFTDGEMLLVESEMELGEYDGSPEGVIKEYLKLFYLKDYLEEKGITGIDLDKYRKEIYAPSASDCIRWDEDVIINTLLDWGDMLSFETVLEDKKDNGNELVVIRAIPTGEFNSNSLVDGKEWKTVYYELEKVNGLWQVIGQTLMDENWALKEQIYESPFLSSGIFVSEYHAKYETGELNILVGSSAENSSETFLGVFFDVLYSEIPAEYDTFPPDVMVNSHFIYTDDKLYVMDLETYNTYIETNELGTGAVLLIDDGEPVSNAPNSYCENYEVKNEGDVYTCTLYRPDGFYEKYVFLRYFGLIEYEEGLHSGEIIINMKSLDSE